MCSIALCIFCLLRMYSRVVRTAAWLGGSEGFKLPRRLVGGGRLRRDLPRKLDLDELAETELQEIVLGHNLTPRKCLDFLTPAQALLKELGRDVQIRFA